MAEELDNQNTPPTEDSRSSEAVKAEILKGQEESPAQETKSEDQVETKPDETSAPEVPERTTDKDNAPEQPLIGDKFKTQEELLKAYHESQNAMRQAQQKASDYEKALEDKVLPPVPGQPDVTVQPNAVPDQEAVMNALEQRYQTYEAQHGPVRANILIQAEIANAIAQNQTAPYEELRASNSVTEQKRTLRADSPLFSKYEGEIDNHLKRMDVGSKLNPNAVKTIYNMVLGEHIDELRTQDTQEASQKAAEIEAQKVKAQVEHQTKTPEEPPVDVDNLSAADLAVHAGLKKIDRY